MIKKFSGFKKFIYLNNIDNDTLNKATSHLELRIVKKGEYFFHEGEPSKFFAGLIKGRICFKKSKIFNRETGEIIYRPLYKVVEKKDDLRNTIRKLTNRDDIKSNKLKQNMDIKGKQIDPKRISVITNMSYFTSFKSKFSLNAQPYRIVKEYFDPQYYNVVEEELFQADSGYCFGEWALIYNQPRSASVIALEDSVFFILDEKIFAKTFLKCLTSTEHKKKKFILETLFPFNLYSDRGNSLYKDIVPKSCVRNQIIYNEGDLADTVYLLYLGTFFLEKNVKNKTMRLKSLERGSILGLESLFEGEENTYKCTLKLSSLNEFGMVACCKVSKLVPYVKQKMKSVFKINYKLYVEYNEDFYLKNINYENNILFKKKNKKEENDETIKQYIKEYSLMEHNEKLKNKLIKFDKFKQVQLSKKAKEVKTERNINIKLLNYKTEIKEVNSFRKIRKNKRSKTIKLKKTCDYGVLTENAGNICEIRRKPVFRKLNTLLPFTGKIDINKENDNIKTINTEMNNDIDNNINKNEISKESSLKMMKMKKFNINLYIKDLLSYNYKPSIIDDLKEKNKNKNALNVEESKTFSKTYYPNFKYKTIETALSRNSQRDFGKTYYTEFPIIKRNKIFRFDSGKYKLPLMAQMFKTK